MHAIVIFIIVFVVMARMPELFTFLVPLHLGKIAFAAGFISLFFLPKGLLGKLKASVPFAHYLFLLFIMAMVSVPFSVWGTGALNSLLSFTRILFFTCCLVLLSAAGHLNQYRAALIYGVSLLAGVMIMSKGAGRISAGFTYDPNDIALLFVTFMPVVLAEAMNGNMVRRGFYLGLGSMVLLGLVLTGSRGAIVAIGVQALYFVLTAKKFRLLALALVCAAGLVVVATAEQSLWDRFASLTAEGEAADYNLEGRSGRVQIWKNGLKIVADNPVLGVGIGMFGTAHFLLDGKIGLTAHNTYLQFAAELGLPGFILYLAMLCSAWQLITRHVEEDERTGARARWIALKVGIVGFGTASFFISAGYSSTLYYLLGLAAVMHFHHVGSSGAPVPQKVRSSAPLRYPPQSALQVRQQKVRL
ncbi:O-antigen polymerase [Desulfomicrobium baculatum DSM 4028]|uniref:O-antigen polymerase n=2 Tax=Desulfomicrobium baculatum TaxID=899 RepID=C7LPR5_DESBD|nr:O-antigen polymerase [Desulfomicrobium baculatum DSM 4028]